MKKFLSIIFLIILIIALLGVGFHKYRSNFNTKKWIEDPSKRVNIVDDLISNYKLMGMSKTEVMKLLREPTEEAYFKEENNIVYYLGNERGFISIDSEWLVLHFDEQGKVNKYQILTD